MPPVNPPEGFNNKAVPFVGPDDFLSFGKYRGEKLQSIIDVDPSYVLWAVRERVFRTAPSAIQEAIRNDRWEREQEENECEEKDYVEREYEE